MEIIGGGRIFQGGLCYGGSGVLQHQNVERRSVNHRGDPDKGTHLGVVLTRRGHSNWTACNARLLKSTGMCVHLFTYIHTCPHIPYTHAHTHVCTHRHTYACSSSHVCPHMAISDSSSDTVSMAVVLLVRLSAARGSCSLAKGLLPG